MLKTLRLSTGTKSIYLTKMHRHWPWCQEASDWWGNALVSLWAASQHCGSSLVHSLQARGWSSSSPSLPLLLYPLSCDCSPSGFRAIITTSSFGNNFSLSLFTHTCSLPIDSVFFRLLCFLPFLLYGKSILGSRRPSDFCCIPRPHPLTCPASPSLVSHLPSASSSFPFSPAAPPLLHWDSPLAILSCGDDHDSVVCFLLQ